MCSLQAILTSVFVSEAGKAAGIDWYVNGNDDSWGKGMHQLMLSFTDCAAVKLHMQVHVCADFTNPAMDVDSVHVWQILLTKRIILHALLLFFSPIRKICSMLCYFCFSRELELSPSY